MNKALFLIAAIYTLSFHAQTVQSTCVAPDSVVWKYRDDADKMAVRRVFHVSSSYKDTIAINKLIRDKYLNALLAVYNATTIPARDSVVNMFDIHIYGNNVNGVSLRADSNLQWMKNLRTNTLPCGNTSIDYFINKYYLKKISYTHNLIYPSADVNFKVDTNCNTGALADTLRHISGILLAGGGQGYYGDGSKIEDSVTTNYTWLVYSYGWGDCQSGCIYRKFWQFKVYNDCSVEYGGTFGAPIDVGIKENELKVAFKVYPNPVDCDFRVHFDGLLSKELRVVISDALGQLVATINRVNSDQELNIKHLPAGIYFLRLENETGYKVVKLLKE